METGRCKICDGRILYLETKNHIQFGGSIPPVQKDDMCPKCWTKNNPGKPADQILDFVAFQNFLVGKQL